MKDEKEEELISTDSDAHGTQYIGSVSGNLQSSMANAYPFTISPQELTNIVNKYKERDENMQDINYFKQKGGIDFLLESVMTDKNKGISSTVGREEYYGSNKIFRKPPPSFWDFVIEALSDKMIIILIFCSIFEIGISLYYIFGEEQTDNIDWIDGTSIIIAVLVVVSVGSITNYKKEMKFQDLNNIQQGTTKYNVVRNGIPQLIISDDILVGDLIKINYGEILPADMLLVEGNGIKIDESALTGESNAVKKNSYEKCLDELETGERNPSSMILLSGTNVIEGTGKCIAIAIGEHSQKGIIRGTIDNASEDNKTPLEHKLNTIADLIGYFGLGSAVVTLVALLIQMIVRYSIGSEEFEVSSFIKNLISIIILCVSIIVVAIPEGLPLAVTLSLSFSIKKLMDNNNLVRKMHACETMGGANYICTDKTGTLTKNEMSVFQVLTGSWKKELKQNREVEEVGKLDNANKNPDEVIQIREDHTTLFTNEKYWETLKVAISVNVDASIRKLETTNINGDNEVCETKNKTDKAFIDFLYRFRSPISIQKDKYLKDEGSFKQFPFDSKRKRMTTFIKHKDFDTGYRLFSKGGGENARLFCRYYLDPNTGEKKTLDDSISTQIKQSIEEFNKDKLRSLYIAYKDINQNQFDNCEKPDSNGKLIDQEDLIFLAVFGIKDSLRDGVKEAVKKCHDASVNVIMVTGDNIVTATAIAKDCGILGNDVDLKNLGPKDIESDPEMMNDPSKKENYIQNILENQPKALTGNSFYNSVGGLICEVCQEDTNLCKCPKTESEAKQLAEKSGQPQKKVKKDIIKNMDNFKKVTKNLRVMARSQPLHKYALVLGLKSLKNVVAVTGDGTNDAPALSKSDVGFAMFAGTDIAKEASDIVIIDNNFSSIVTAIIYGRNIYDNIRKFLQFQLSVNFCACILVFVCACVGNDTPLTPIQMLWVNLIMDSLGSLALATEPPYEELLQRAPTRRNESMINGRMWKHIVIQSLVQIIILVIFYLLAPEFIKEDNLIRLSANRLIKFCYTKYPGKDVDHIIYGTEVKWPTDGKLRNQYKLYCGEYVHRNTLYEAYKEYNNANSATVHLTLIFNIFVFYTLFNQINCRVIDDSLNIFVRITKSYLFIIICIVEMGLQVLIIFVGKSPIHVVNDGLTGNQWGICIGFSAITFVVSIIVKFIPIHICIDSYLDKKIKQEEEEEEKLEENENASQNNAKTDIGKRTMTRRLSKRSGKSLQIDTKGASGNQGVNIYNMKKGE